MLGKPNILGALARDQMKLSCQYSYSLSTSIPGTKLNKCQKKKKKKKTSEIRNINLPILIIQPLKQAFNHISYTFT